MTGAVGSSGTAGPVTVRMPLLNANEQEAVVVTLSVGDGQRVQAGDVLLEVETTKAVEEICAEAAGFVSGLRVAVSESVPVGATLCFIAPDPQWRPPAVAAETETEAEISEGTLRMTEPARELAVALAIDAALLPHDRLITTETVRRLAADGAPLEQQAGVDGSESRVDASSIIVYGAGGHGKTLVELLRALRGYRIVGVIDDAVPVDDVFGVPVLGGADQLVSLRAQGIALAVNAVGTIGSSAARLRVSTELQRAGFVLPVLVHPSAVVEQSATLAGGAQILSLSYVGSDATVGTDCIVNTGAIVSHDCVLGQHVHLAPGAMVAGGARIGDRTVIGMGATVYVGIRIGSDVRIGNGAQVHADVPDSAVVPTGSVWPR